VEKGREEAAMDYEDIIYAKEGGKARTTINRPDKMNSFL
jgi:1,4-dihydroxy-2-naphthoyl-CoA synthase